MRLLPFSKSISRRFRIEERLMDRSFYQDFNKELERRGVVYTRNGETLPAPVYFQPNFINSNEEREIQRLNDDINFFFQDVYRILLNDPSLCKYLGVPQNFLDYFGRTKNPAKSFRADFGILKNSKAPVAFEFNTNCPGGMFNVDEAERLFLETHPVIRKLSQQYTFSAHERFNLFVDMIQDQYTEFKKLRKKDLGDLILILGVGDDESSQTSYRQIQRGFERRGLNAKIILAGDPKLKYEGGRVTYDNERVAVINRRITTDENLRKVGFLKEASQRGDVLVLNPFGSKVLGLKKLFVLVNKPEVKGRMSELNRDFVNRYLPTTHEIRDIKEADLEEVIYDKDNWLLKIDGQYKGKGIQFGKDMSSSDWKTVIGKLRRRAQRNKTFNVVIQQRKDLVRVRSKNNVEGLALDYDIISNGGIATPFLRVAGEISPDKANLGAGGSYVVSLRYKKK